jgi:hypothetical protein
MLRKKGKKRGRKEGRMGGKDGARPTSYDDVDLNAAVGKS